jgi:DNA-directed RNA polymerase specialized sigma24 family protein
MAGSASQLEELYRRRYAVFRHAVAGYLGSSEGAHDAVQEGFARALARRETFRGEGSLEAWSTGSCCAPPASRAAARATSGWPRS